MHIWNKLLFSKGHIIYTDEAEKNLLVCLSGKAVQALYGMAPCFGHTRVTFDVENDTPGLGRLRGHFEADRDRFFEIKGFVLRL